jgi:hypothetical protein
MHQKEAAMHRGRWEKAMKRTLTTIRCVPRYGYDFASVRTVDLDLPEGWDDDDLKPILETWFGQRGIADAVYAVEVDDDGFFAVINDEVFHVAWGEELF